LSDPIRRDALIFTLLALIVGVGMAALTQHPSYTDAYYYFNAGQRLVQGNGLTDAAIWTYLGAPSGLPIPSHLYWMPLASLVAAAGMGIGGPTFDGAQIFFVPLYVGLALTGFALGALLGKSRRVTWLAGLLTLFSGLYMPFWVTTDTFALYGLVGSLCLLTMGLGRQSRAPYRWCWFAVSGALAGLAHLARADGLLLVAVLVVVALWTESDLTPQPPLQTMERGPEVSWTQHKFLPAFIGVLAYLLVMLPWFARNLSAVGSILPVGGMQTAWMRSYDEIVNYPPGTDLQTFLAWGLPNIAASRGEAFSQNFQTFIAVEGLVILAPLMLIGLWRRRHDPILSGFWLYALGVHLVMTLVFAYPGWRGGLLHSSAALLPFWAVLGVLGLDDVLAWVAPRRRWRLNEARAFFGASLVLWAAIFSALNFFGKRSAGDTAGVFFRNLTAHLPPDAVVMINDPSAMYYYTGIPGVVVPNAPPDRIMDIALRYGVNTLVLDGNLTEPMIELYKGKNIPPFLKLIYAEGNIRIYRIEILLDTAAG
jgi:hypothetical protein